LTHLGIDDDDNDDEKEGEEWQKKLIKYFFN
jgi:hypothetical protein